MKLIDLLLVAALTSATVAVCMAVFVPAGLAVFSVGCVALWYFLGDEGEG